MGLKQLVVRQRRDTLNQASPAAQWLQVPPEGWLKTARMALNMSAVQLARRLGVTRSLISQTERAELTGGVTLRNMQRMASALGYEFVYGVIPKDSVEQIVWLRALEKARQGVSAASVHMALEDQMLKPDQQEREIERQAKELALASASSLWEDA